MIKVIINGKTTSVDGRTTLEQLLSDTDAGTGTIAVAVNKVFVPRSQYQDTFINDDDQVEIVAPIQGG